MIFKANKSKYHYKQQFSYHTDGGLFTSMIAKCQPLRIGTETQVYALRMDWKYFFRKKTMDVEDVWALSYNFHSYSFILNTIILEATHINEL